MLVVLGSLSLLALIISILGKAFTNAPTPQPKSQKSAPPPNNSPPNTATSPAPIPQEIQAVIVAAVYSTLQQPVQILSVQAAPPPQLAAWSMEGRRQIFLSHKIR
ncbi:MAG: OadG family transporter subunit [Chthoniobacterales bacterium]|nr:OadG family transporter subunit [Chthoniobacterales bacterium]